MHNIMCMFFEAYLDTVDGLKILTPIKFYVHIVSIWKTISVVNHDFLRFKELHMGDS